MLLSRPVAWRHKRRRWLRILDAAFDAIAPEAVRRLGRQRRERRQLRHPAGRRPAGPRRRCRSRGRAPRAARRHRASSARRRAGAGSPAGHGGRPCRDRDRPRGCGRAAAGWRAAGSAHPARSRSCAAARQASSVSAADRKTISPGVWPRSRAALPSEMLPGLAARRCIGAQTAPAASAAVMARRSRPFSPITTSRLAALLARRPGAVVVMLQPAADALQHEAHLLAGDGEESLDPQDVVLADDRRGDRLQELLRRAQLRQLDMEALEIVVVVARPRRRDGWGAGRDRPRPRPRGRAGSGHRWRRSSPARP